MQVPAMIDAVRAIFKHMHMLKTKNLSYPVERALKLVEAVARDLADVLTKMLSTKRLMQLPYDKFEQVTGGCEELFKTWEENLRDFRDKAKHMAERQVRTGEPKKKNLKIDHELKPLHERIEYVRSFRKQHEELRNVIQTVLGTTTATSEFVAETELKNAFDNVKVIHLPTRTLALSFFEFTQ